MRIERIVSLIGGFFFLLFTVGMYQYGNSFMLAVNPLDPLRNAAVPIVGHKGDHRGFQPGYLEMASHGEMAIGRTVQVDALVPVRALVARGDSLPRREDLPLFASARAAVYAQDECARLMEVLAAQCEVREARATAENDHVSIRMTLAFVEKDPFGRIDGAAQRVYARSSRTFAPMARNVPVSQAERERMRLYRLAVDGCREIRRREHNCSIVGLRIVGRKMHAHGIEMDATVDYGFLVARN